MAPECGTLGLRHPSIGLQAPRDPFCHPSEYVKIGVFIPQTPPIELANPTTWLLGKKLIAFAISKDYRDIRFGSFPLLYRYNAVDFASLLRSQFEKSLEFFPAPRT